MNDKFVKNRKKNKVMENSLFFVISGEKKKKKGKQKSLSFGKGWKFMESVCVCRNEK